MGGKGLPMPAGIIPVLLMIVIFLWLLKFCEAGVGLSAIPVSIPLKVKGNAIELTKDRDYYLKTALAGALSCSITHSMVLPLDVLKTRIQTDFSSGKMRMREVWKIIFAKEGAWGFTRGLGAVSTGYFMQGAVKFGLYELLKDRFTEYLQPRGLYHKLPSYMAASALAEVVATAVLCPMEVTKIAIMMNKQFVPLRYHGSVMSTIVRDGGVLALWKGLPLIMLRQVPYSCVKLVSYDVMTETFGNWLQRQEQKRVGNLCLLVTDPKTGKVSTACPNVSKALTTKEGRKTKAVTEKPLIPRIVQVGCGVASGVLAATLSQPADVLLSRVCAAEFFLGPIMTPSVASSTLKQLGWRGSFSGLRPRAIMIGTMAAGQFFVYEEVKEALIRKK